MDDRSFDAFAKLLASGASRRTALKGLLGLGVALPTAALIGNESEAARRPSPTPKPTRCPGNQVPSNGSCVCPDDAPEQCGPACCTGVHGDPPSSTHSECCDNACCFGTCYGEELCCPTNPTGPGGTAQAEYCAGSAVDLCCTGNQICCDAGTDRNTCVDLTIEGVCCTVDDCPAPDDACSVVCDAHQCQSVVCNEADVCCNGTCCPSERCNMDEGVCCSEGQTACGTGDSTCCSAPAICCEGSDTCCAEAQCNDNGVCCSGDALACFSDCCPEDRCSASGCCDEGTLACGDSCCPTGAYFCNDLLQCECHPGTETCGLACCPIGQCNDDGTCCAAGTIACGSACCDGYTKYCTETNVCACASGQCCNGDTSTCSEFGFDPICAVCDGGTCSAAPQYQDCDAAIPGGWCNNGKCHACSASPGTWCESFNQCCGRQGFGCVHGVCQKGG